MRQAEPLSIDARSVARAADGVLDTSRELAQASGDLLSTLDVGDGWFSALPAAAALTTVHADALADGQDLLGSIGAALAGDADRLYQVAFWLHASDANAAARLRGHR